MPTSTSNNLFLEELHQQLSTQDLEDHRSLKQLYSVKRIDIANRVLYTLRTFDEHKEVEEFLGWLRFGKRKNWITEEREYSNYRLNRRLNYLKRAEREVYKDIVLMTTSVFNTKEANEEVIISSLELEVGRCINSLYRLLELLKDD